ncbi:ImmA/IrrE family metallo-endopeptidase [Cytophagaceae bacterium YF14B1]|uniref:ImmA/IrrE family metallo-endopeptidase n=1 Tax=Xanthocytophaga flava TaxID=3048013 RepID=A0AAE3UAY4_9BACT|nr:ImmA/IrrE family metallo-endopeptidase [Xanthocytophaga flavus]MDJ1485986.1 ImmA/IrrE family metallo-endopeptidase [Xanthocytophaga flavus]
MLSSKRIEYISNLAEFIANDYCPDSYTEPEIIAQKKGITYSYNHYNDCFDGLLEHCSGKFHIYINLDRVKTKDSPRARHTFAHELGHYFIDEHRNALKKGLVPPHGSITGKYNQKNKAEQEADLFAAHLLMPHKRFLQKAGALKKGILAINTIAQEMKTSILSTAIHYVQQNLICGIVVKWSFDCQKEWALTSKSFQQSVCSNFVKASLIPIRQSATHQIQNRSEINSSHKTSISTLSHWMSGINVGSKQDIVMTEEAITLGPYGSLTLLYPATTV